MVAQDEILVRGTVGRGMERGRDIPAAHMVRPGRVPLTITVPSVTSTLSPGTPMTRLM